MVRMWLSNGLFALSEHFSRREQVESWSLRKAVSSWTSADKLVLSAVDIVLLAIQRAIYYYSFLCLENYILSLIKDKVIINNLSQSINTQSVMVMRHI